MRWALTIDEKSLRREHTNVTIELDHLAHLLQTTDRLTEAEPLSGRALNILLQFHTTTGLTHPHFQQALVKCRTLVKVPGHTNERIEQN